MNPGWKAGLLTSTVGFTALTERSHPGECIFEARWAATPTGSRGAGGQDRPACCGQAPKLIAGILGASPHLSGGDLVSTMGTVGAGAMVVGSAAFAAAGAIRGAAAAGAGASSTPGGSLKSAQLPLPPSGPGGANGGTPQPPPPQGPSSAAQKSGAGAATAASSQVKPKGRLASLRIPPDTAPQAAPPRFNIDHHDD